MFIWFLALRYEVWVNWILKPIEHTQTEITGTVTFPVPIQFKKTQLLRWRICWICGIKEQNKLACHTKNKQWEMTTPTRCGTQKDISLYFTNVIKCHLSNPFQSPLLFLKIKRRTGVKHILTATSSDPWMRTPGCEEALEMLVKDKLSLKSSVKFYRDHILESDYAFGQKDDLREGELGINPNTHTHTHTHTHTYVHTHI